MYKHFNLIYVLCIYIFWCPVYLREQGSECLWLFFEAKRGPRAKEVLETLV